MADESKTLIVEEQDYMSRSVKKLKSGDVLSPMDGVEAINLNNSEAEPEETVEDMEDDQVLDLGPEPENKQSQENVDANLVRAKPNQEVSNLELTNQGSQLRQKKAETPIQGSKRQNPSPQFANSTKKPSKTHLEKAQEHTVVVSHSTRSPAKAKDSVPRAPPKGPPNPPKAKQKDFDEILYHMKMAEKRNGTVDKLQKIVFHFSAAISSWQDVMLLSCIMAFFMNYFAFLNTTLDSALTQIENLLTEKNIKGDIALHVAARAKNVNAEKPVVTKEIVDDDKCESGDAFSKKLKKKRIKWLTAKILHQVIRGDKRAPVMESENEDGFPIFKSDKGESDSPKVEVKN
ncbi:nucleotide-sugar uncharacterized transporter 3 [Senna tora]|uniref:Nucleotide-sugar uncharacterized transporter 3 n=1 Tax=Senna tora TaxID=362788 RepID=A0A834WMV5_9FABA|nr:nucleotide-sugar uncharacterized transporter 3 [Senna tora]